MDRQNGLLSPIVTGSDMAMMTIGNKVARGADLLSSERLTAISVGAHDARMANMHDMTTPKPEPLPEIAKGAIANHMG